MGVERRSRGCSGPPPVRSAAIDRPGSSGRRFSIVFDFDGTILPSTPWDSEQSLLLARMEGSRARMLAPRRLYCRLVIEADRRGWLGASFKSHYLRLLRGTGSDLLEQVAERLAERISPGARRTIASLEERGHRLIIASCGTADLIERILEASGVLRCFERVLGNRFVFMDGRIASMDMSVPTPRAKLEAIQTMGLAPESTVAVGDGLTDIPLLKWAGIPVAVASKGVKRVAWAPKGCSVIASIPQLGDIIQRQGG